METKPKIRIVSGKQIQSSHLHPPPPEIPPKPSLLFKLLILGDDHETNGLATFGKSYSNIAFKSHIMHRFLHPYNNQTDMRYNSVGKRMTDADDNVPEYYKKDVSFCHQGIDNKTHHSCVRSCVRLQLWNLSSTFTSFSGKNSVYKNIFQNISAVILIYTLPPSRSMDHFSSFSRKEEIKSYVQKWSDFLSNRTETKTTVFIFLNEHHDYADRHQAKSELYWVDIARFMEKELTSFYDKNRIEIKDWFLVYSYTCDSMSGMNAEDDDGVMSAFLSVITSLISENE